MSDKMIPVGAKVRLTAKFLKNTGQVNTVSARSHWTIRMCMCSMCKRGYVCTDEEFDEEYRTSMWGDLPENERPKYRHLAIANIQIVR